MCYLPLINTVVTSLGVIFLAIYAFATRGIQIATQDQIEGQQKPCLTLCAKARDYVDATIEPNAVIGAMVLATQEGTVSLQNIGNGLALNVRYDYTQVTPTDDRDQVGGGSYLQHIPTGKSFPIPVSEARMRNRKCEIVATYESLSGRKYESRIQINNAVITEISFAQIKRPWCRS
jgi:hypothetical protein